MITTFLTMCFMAMSYYYVNSGRNGLKLLIHLVYEPRTENKNSISLSLLKEAIKDLLTAIAIPVIIISWSVNLFPFTSAIAYQKVTYAFGYNSELTNHNQRIASIPIDLMPHFDFYFDSDNTWKSEESFYRAAKLVSMNEFDEEYIKFIGSKPGHKFTKAITLTKLIKDEHAETGGQINE